MSRCRVQSLVNYVFLDTVYPALKRQGMVIDECLQEQARPRWTGPVALG
jgi:hypothetical protein